MQSTETLWTRNFILSSLLNAQTVIIFYLLIVVIGVFAIDQLDASKATAGLTSGIFIVGALIGRLIIGRVSRALGVRKTLMLGLWLYLVFSAAYFFVESVTSLIVLRVLHGVALGIANTAIGTIISQSIPASRKGEGIGYYSMSTTLATAIGPFLGLYFLDVGGYALIFEFCIALCALSLVTAYWVKVPVVEVEQPDTSLPLLSLRSYIEPAALGIGAVIFLYAMCYSGVLSFIRLFADSVGLVEAAMYFFLFYSLAILLSRPFSGKWMDRYGENKIMYPCFFIFIAGLVLLSQTTSALHFFIAAFLIGLGFGNLQSISQAIVVKLAPPGRMGFATATYFIFLDAGIGVGPFLLGGFIALWGYEVLYLLLAAVVLISCLLYIPLHGRRAVAHHKSE